MRGVILLATVAALQLQPHAEITGGPSGDWTVGEVLAWLVRPRPTPAAVVDAWMRSKPHKAVLLHPSFRQVGAAYARGNPLVERDAGATFAAVFGRRS